MELHDIEAKVLTLRQEYGRIDDAGKAIFAKAHKENRDLNDEERDQVDKLQAELQNVESDLDRYERQAKNTRNGQRFEPDDDPNTRPDPAQMQADRQKWESAGDFLKAVLDSSAPGAQVDPRLVPEAAAATTYGNTTTGVDGGFLVPTEHSLSIAEHMIADEDLLSLCDNVTVSGNSMTFPSDETTPWGTDGIIAYWAAEAGTVTQTKPVFGERSLKLNKLMCLVPITDELMEDSVALGSYVPAKMAQKIQWKVNNAIVNGNGVGQPKGITTSSAIVTQAKETSQTADTINAANTSKMLGRLLRGNGASTRRWLINPDSWNQLPLMTIGDQPVFTPPTEGIKGAPNGTLWGIPVLMSDTCQTLGDLNDIILADFGGYRTITKSAGIQQAMSMHLFFDYDQTAFRATFRVDGQTKHNTAVTPPNSSVTRSPFVNLAARA